METKTYYDILREKRDKAKEQLDAFDARKDDFSEENFQRRRKQYEDKLAKAEKVLSSHLTHMMTYMQKHHPEAFQETIDEAVDKLVEEGRVEDDETTGRD